MKSIYEKRENGKTVKVFTRTGQRAAEELANYMVAKYMNKVPWIKSARREPDYGTGGDKITFRLECGDVLTVYTARDEE